MKNTKHTENLDNSTPQEITSQSKRKILTSIGVSSGILGASALSQQWTKPIVNSIILPAHAQTTDMMGTDPMDGTDPMTDPTTPPATTPEPAMGPMIMLDAFHAQDFDGGVVETGDIGTVRVTLSVMPTAPVTVTLAGAAAVVGGGLTLMFDNVSYDKAQEIMITAGDAPESMADEDESMVTLTAKGGNYDDVKAELTYTVGYYSVEEEVGNLKVKLTDRTAPGEATVTWDKPKTRAVVEEYQVSSSNATPKVEISGMMAEVSDMASGGHTFTVKVLYEDADAFTNGEVATGENVVTVV